MNSAHYGTLSITDKYGHSLTTNGHPATFNGKRLVVASTCELHPKYQALRPPRSKKPGCVCAEIYRQQEERA